MMKIMQVIYTLSSGGAERLVVDLCNEFARAGHDVEICVVRDLSIPKNAFYLVDLDKRIKVRNLRIASKSFFPYISRIYKALKECQPDIVHAHLNVVKYLFLWALLYKGIYKFVHTIHNEADKEVKNKLEWLLRRFFYKRRLIQPVTISNSTTRSFVEFYGVDTYVQIDNGRSRMANHGQGAEPAFLKKLHGYTLFVHVARFAKQKNQEMLIHAFNELSQNQKNVALLVVGAGFDSPDGLELQKKATENIYFLGETRDVGWFYRNCDAFCLSSFHEGMPITLIEALSEGCVPICTRAGGVVDMIEHGKTGLLSDDFTAESYLKMLSYFLEHKDSFSRASIKASFEQRYSIERCAKSYLELYAM